MCMPSVLLVLISMFFGTWGDIPIVLVSAINVCFHMRMARSHSLPRTESTSLSPTKSSFDAGYFTSYQRASSRYGTAVYTPAHTYRTTSNEQGKLCKPCEMCRRPQQSRAPPVLNSRRPRAGPNRCSACRESTLSYALDVRDLLALSHSAKADGITRERLPEATWTSDSDKVNLPCYRLSTAQGTDLPFDTEIMVFCRQPHCLGSVPMGIPSVDESDRSSEGLLSRSPFHGEHQASRPRTYLSSIASSRPV